MSRCYKDLNKGALEAKCRSKILKLKINVEIEIHVVLERFHKLSPWLIKIEKYCCGCWDSRPVHTGQKRDKTKTVLRVLLISGSLYTYIIILILDLLSKYEATFNNGGHDNIWGYHAKQRSWYLKGSTSSGWSYDWCLRGRAKRKS